MRVLLHDSTAGVEADEMLHALVSGLLVVVASSLVGTWVVLRGLTFLGEALAHARDPRRGRRAWCGASIRCSARR